MHRAMREITELTQSHSLDLIIETRDARLPLTSINPAFERLLAQQAGHGQGIGARLGGGIGQTKRMIVYNKADLAQECFREVRCAFYFPLPPFIPLTSFLCSLYNELWRSRERRTFFSPTLVPTLKYVACYVLPFVRSILPPLVTSYLTDALRLAGLAKRPLIGTDDKINMLVAGMPNVGKSSILNALRRVGVKKGALLLPRLLPFLAELPHYLAGKAASTSSEPGHTRRLSTVIKIATSPPVYIYDTPGIMVPFLGKGVTGQEAALKLALTGGIKESLFEGDVVAEYLLWRLRIKAEMRDEGWSNCAFLPSAFSPSDR